MSILWVGNMNGTGTTQQSTYKRMSCLLASNGLFGESEFRVFQLWAAAIFVCFNFLPLPLFSLHCLTK